MSALKQGLTVSLLTLCSRILGFVREAVAAQLFGASAATDAFYAVFRLPNALRQVFAEGAFSLALVPLLHAARRTSGPTGEAELAGRVLGMLLIVLLPLSLLGLLLAPWITQWVLPSFDDGATAALALQTFYWTLPYVLIVGFLGWSAALLHAHDRFAAAAIAPLLLSLCLIFIPLFYASSLQQPVLALGIAVLAGGILQLLWQGAAVLQLKLRPRLLWDWRHPSLRAASAVLLPSLLAVSTLQIILVIDSVFASQLTPGSVTWLYLADRIVQFPQGVIGTALSVVLVQRLTSANTTSTTKSFAHVLDRALRLVVLLSALCAVVACFGAQPITWTLYGYGQFSAADVEKTAAVIATMAAGVPAVLLVRALSAACLAHGASRALVRASVLAVMVDLFGNLLLQQLPSSSLSAGPMRIAALSALAVWTYAALLLHTVWAQGIWRPSAGTRRFVLQVMLAAGACALVLLAAQSAENVAWATLGAWQRLWRLVLLLASAVLVFFASAALSGLRYKDLR